MKIETKPAMETMENSDSYLVCRFQVCQPLDGCGRQRTRSCGLYMVDRKFVLHHGSNPPTVERLKSKAAAKKGKQLAVDSTLLWYANQHRECSRNGGGWFCGGMYQRWLWATAAWAESMQRLAKQSGLDSRIQHDSCTVGERMDSNE
jgi:hypothetical protein